MTVKQLYDILTECMEEGKEDFQVTVAVGNTRDEVDKVTIMPAMRIVEVETSNRLKFNR